MRNYPVLLILILALTALCMLNCQSTSPTPNLSTSVPAEVTETTAEADEAVSDQPRPRSSPEPAVSVTETKIRSVANANPIFERVVNLGVPVGNGASPRALALNEADQRLYILTQDTPILDDGIGLSVYDLVQGDVTLHRKINQRTAEPLDVQVDPTLGLVYALWQASYDQPPTLSLLTASDLAPVDQFDGVSAFVAIAGRLYTVNAQTVSLLSLEPRPTVENRDVAHAGIGQRRQLAVDLTANRLYLAHETLSGWVLSIFTADDLNLLTTQTVPHEVLDLRPNPVKGELYLLLNDMGRRLLAPVDGAGLPLREPFLLAESYQRMGLALSNDGETLYVSNGGYADSSQHSTPTPQLIALSTADFAPQQTIDLPHNAEDVVLDGTGLAWGVYPPAHQLLAVDLSRAAVTVIPTAMDVVDVVVDEANDWLYLSDTALRVRKLTRSTLEQVAEIQLSGDSYGFGGLTLDSGRLYVDGNPMFVLNTADMTEFAQLTPGGQVALSNDGAELYLSRCGLTKLNADELITRQVVPGSEAVPNGPVPNPCVVWTAADTQHQRLYSLTDNGVPGSNSGNYLRVYHTESDPPSLSFEDFAISLGQPLPVPERGRLYLSYRRHTDRAIRQMTVQTDGKLTYTAQLWGIAGSMAYQPMLNRLYVTSDDRLHVLDGDHLGLLGELTLPPNHGYEVSAVDSEFVYLRGFNGQLLIATVDGGGQPSDVVRVTGGSDRPASQPTGPVRALYPTPTDELFARIDTPLDAYSSRTYLFVSRDQGATWTDLSINLGPWPTRAIALSPNYATDQTLYVAARAEDGRGGLYRSSDGGQSWQPMWRGLTDLWIDKITVAPLPNESLYALFTHTARHGLFATLARDDDPLWRPIASPDPTRLPYPITERIAGVVTAQGTAFASDTQQLYRTQIADGQLRGWQAVQTATMRLLAASPDGQTLISADDLWRSSDGGQTWQPFSLPQPNIFTAHALWFADQTVYLFYTHPWLAESGLLYRSLDGGQTWQLWRNPLPNRILTSLAPTTDGTGLLLGDESGQVTVLRLEGLSWE